ncbi:MarR family transcriptional regulator [Oceanicaulis alexandrii]|uniref:LexA family protein n=1 Tax=Oceanicaulis alexandrii TaxID=153233 RepID=UPI0035CEA851
MSTDPFSLTVRQQQVLDILITAIDTKGVTPSFQEIADAAHLGSKSGATRVLNALEQRGWIERQHHRARAIRILRRPEDLEAQWLIWSVINGTWWRADQAGYTRVLAEAGRYTRQTALSISGRGRDGWDGTRPPTELPVRLEDVEAAVAMGSEITSAINAHTADQRGRA